MADNTQRSYSVRLGITGDDEVKAKLTQVGDVGDQQLGRVEQAAARTGSQWARMVDGLNPAQAALDTFTRRMDLNNAALAKGVIGGQQHAAAADLIAKAYQGATNALQNHGKAAGEAEGKIRDFREVLRGVTDAATGNIEGLTRASALLANSMGLLGGFLNPITLGIAAIGAGLIVAVTHAESMEAETAKLSVAMRGLGSSAGTSAAQLKELIDQLQRSDGIDRGEAALGVSSLLRSGQFNGQDIASLADVAANAAARYGTSFADATNKIVEMSARGISAIKSTDEAWHFLTADELANIDALAKNGQQTEAFKIALEALARAADGAARQSIPDATREINAFKKEWDELLDALGTNVGMPVLEKLTEYFHALNNPGQGSIFANALLLAQGNFTPLLPSAGPPAPSSNQNGVVVPIPPPSAGGPSGGRTTADQAQAYADLTKRLEEETRAESAAQGVRARSIAIAQADRQAEELAAANHFTAAQKRQLQADLEAQALQKLSNAERDHSEQLTLEAQLENKVAAAYEQSAAAGLRAAAAAEAAREKQRDATVNEAERTRQILEQQAGAAQVKSAQDLDATKLAADGQERLAAAAKVSAAAEHEAELQNRMTAATYQLLAAAANGSAEQQQKANELAGQIRQQIRREDTAAGEASVQNEIRLQQDNLQILQAELAAGRGQKEIGQEQLQLLRQMLDIRERFPQASEQEVQQLAAVAVQQGRINALIQQQKADQKELAQYAKTAAEDLLTAFDALVNKTSSAKDVIKNLETSLQHLVEDAFVKKPLENMIDQFIGGQNKGSSGGAIGNLFGSGGLLGKIFGSGKDPANDNAGGAGVGSDLLAKLGLGAGANPLQGLTQTIATANINVTNGNITGGGGGGGGGSLGGLGNLFGSGGGGSSDLSGYTSNLSDSLGGLDTTTAESAGVAFMSSGGVVGRHGSIGRVPLSIFRGAPSFGIGGMVMQGIAKAMAGHGGVGAAFAPGAVPIVAHAGEIVLNHAQQGNVASALTRPAVHQTNNYYFSGDGARSAGDRFGYSANQNSRNLIEQIVRLQSRS